VLTHDEDIDTAQMSAGMMGFFFVGSHDTRLHAVDRDFVFLLNAFDIEPCSKRPKNSTMLDFNL
jgi:hypothetical protein